MFRGWRWFQQFFTDLWTTFCCPSWIFTKEFEVYTHLLRWRVLRQGPCVCFSPTTAPVLPSGHHQNVHLFLLDCVGGLNTNFLLTYKTIVFVSVGYSFRLIIWHFKESWPNVFVSVFCPLDLLPQLITDLSWTFSLHHPELFVLSIDCPSSTLFPHCQSFRFLSSSQPLIVLLKFHLVQIFQKCHDQLW